MQSRNTGRGRWEFPFNNPANLPLGNHRAHLAPAAGAARFLAGWGWPMTTDILALVASYFLCSAAAERQMLSEDQSAQCSAILSELKQSFAEIQKDGTDRQNRAMIVGRGDDGYRSWLAENPQLAARLRAEAHTQLAMFSF